ncbi:FG-GAP repeat domain-containing protein [Flagellimonas allohymeniacidonis]|uniref:VCBS repeat-containing protein n=1 Tax=Flagellimonas allohymeniacidonis TaxID=2517819 RepID=A0A4Q8QC53_9FLAO|nr:VCBS repeat-containing protein [Allomuricauda hymeniacidonis]TAI46997.1 VCBS repeat-containing protein [Allomuricauda hymeniacidonis]
MSGKYWVLVLFVILVFSALLAFHTIPLDSQIQTALPFKNVTNTNLEGIDTSKNSMDVEAVDIDKDGDLDLVIAKEFQPNQILINDGSGKFTDESRSRLPQNRHDSEHIAIADFDNDNDLDIIFVSEDDKTNEYYLNDGKGFFKKSSALQNFLGVSNVVIAPDVNNDAHPDLIIGNRGNNFLLINDGKGNFKDESKKRLDLNSETTQDMEAVDIDNDGDLDLLEANESISRILINDGNGHFTDESQERLNIGKHQTREIEAGDLDNDGDIDLFLANVDFGGIGNPQNRLLINDGKGYFQDITATGLPSSSLRTVGALLYDLDHDGFLDIVAGNRFNGMQQLVLLNNGENTFVDHTADYFPKLDHYTFDVAFADFNGDGLADVYLANFRGSDVLLFQTKP